MLTWEEETAEMEDWASHHTGRGGTAPKCLCGRFARFVRFEGNTMPHGEAVTTVDCTRCGEVRVR